MTYAARWSPASLKELEALPKDVMVKADERVLALCSEPRPSGVKKLRGAKNTYRIRFKDKYRILFVIDDEHQQLLIQAIDNRDDVYR